MATLAVTHPTLLDVKTRTDCDGNVAKIVEILNLTNEIIDDAVWVEANEATGHTTTIRTGLPTPTWRKLYGGVQPAKSTTVRVTDSMGMLEAYAEVDKKLADLNGNTAAFRMTEDMAHLEGMNQEFASTLFYGNEGTAPEEFTGLAPRFNSTTAENGENIFSAGGSGSDNTSIWLVVWGPTTAHCIYPKGVPGGLQFKDMGEVTIESIDGAGGRMQAYRSHYSWDCGVSVRDWRYIVRIPNIDVSDLLALSTTQAISASTSILRLMTKALDWVPSLNVGRPVFYANRTVRAMLRQCILDKAANNLTFDTIAGKKVIAFDGIPVRRCDSLVNTESVVS